MLTLTSCDCGATSGAMNDDNWRLRACKCSDATTDSARIGTPSYTRRMASVPEDLQRQVFGRVIVPSTVLTLTPANTSLLGGYKFKAIYINPGFMRQDKTDQEACVCFVGVSRFCKASKHWSS